LVKQQQQSTKTVLPHEEPINAETLLRTHTLTEQIIGQLRKKNSENLAEVEVEDYWGVSSGAGPARKRVKLSETNAFVVYENSYSKKGKLRWLSQSQNQRSHQFYSLENLINNSVISENERELFEFPPGITDFPYRQIYQFYRIKRGDNSEYFSAHEQWSGISNTATVVTVSVPDFYYFIKPAVSYELRNLDGTPVQAGQSIVDNKTVQIATTKMTPHGDIAGRREYILRFTPEVAYSALKLARGQVGDHHNGSSMVLIKEGNTNPVGVKDPKLWAEAPFDELWEELRKPAPQINIDSHDLLNYLKSNEASKNKDAYQ
jgi:hypothetical protein